MARRRNAALQGSIIRQSNSPRDPGYGIDNRDEAARWLAQADPDPACDHDFATIANQQGEVTHRFCLLCKARRAPE